MRVGGQRWGQKTNRPEGLSKEGRDTVAVERGEEQILKPGTLGMGIPCG